jgi:hypothetical protein
MEFDLTAFAIAPLNVRPRPATQELEPQQSKMPLEIAEYIVTNGVYHVIVGGRGDGGGGSGSMNYPYMMPSIPPNPPVQVPTRRDDDRPKYILPRADQMVTSPCRRAVIMPAFGTGDSSRSSSFNNSSNSPRSCGGSSSPRSRSKSCNPVFSSRSKSRYSL